MLSAADRDRAMGHLGYPIDEYHTAALYGACKELETYGGIIAEDRVIGYMDSLDRLLAAIAEGAATAGLIQADVLKWESSGKGQLSGYYNEYDRIKRLLFATFKLKPYSDSSSAGGGNILCRS